MTLIIDIITRIGFINFKLYFLKQNKDNPNQNMLSRLKIILHILYKIVKIKLINDKFGIN